MGIILFFLIITGIFLGIGAWLFLDMFNGYNSNMKKKKVDKKRSDSRGSSKLSP